VFAVIFHNYLTNKVNNLILKLEGQVNTLILMINKSKTAWSGEERRTRP
jgi:biopolymer transport protein ExbB